MNNPLSTTPVRVPAVVLSCSGAPEGDLNVVRSLGEQGVPVIVVSEYADPPSRLSRYCTEFIQVPDFDNPSALSDVLAALRVGSVDRCRCSRRRIPTWRR